MKRLTVPFALLAATMATAQVPPANETPPAAPPKKAYKPLGFDVHIGYGFSPSFNANGGSHHLNGPEIGVAIPIGTFLNQGVALEPSVFGGGRIAHGSDDDSDVYRLTLFLRHAFARGVQVRAGLGYAVSTRARGRTFDGQGGIVGDVGVEIPFSLKLIGSVDPYLDVHGLLGSERRLGGFFVGLGVRL